MPLERREHLPTIFQNCARGQISGQYQTDVFESSTCRNLHVTEEEEVSLITKYVTIIIDKNI